MLLGTLGGSLLTRRGLFRAGSGQRLFRARQGIKKKSLIPFHPLTNYYFSKEKRFNGVFS